MQICISVTDLHLSYGGYGGGSKNQPDIQSYLLDTEPVNSGLPACRSALQRLLRRQEAFFLKTTCAPATVASFSSRPQNGPEGHVSPGGGRGLAACSMRRDDSCKTVRGFLLISALFITGRSVSSALHSLTNISTRHYHLAFLWFPAILCTRSSQTCRPPGNPRL